MTKGAHKKLFSDFKENVDDSIHEIFEDKENYPSFYSITHKNDLTEFTINVDTNTYNDLPGFAALEFYIEDNIYQTLNTVPENKLKPL